MEDMPIYYNGEIYTEWESPIPDTPCSVLLVSEDEKYTQVSIPTREQKNIMKVSSEGIYYRHISCLIDPVTGKNTILNPEYIQVFLTPAPTDDIPQEEPPTEDDTQQTDPNIEEIPTETEIPIQDTEYKEYIPNDFSKETSIDLPEILGEKTDVKRCNMSILNKKQYQIKEFNCNLNVEISRMSYIQQDDKYILNIQGNLPEKMNFSIKIYECKHFTLVDPQTWFECKERLVDWFKTDITPIYKGNGIVFSNNTFTIDKIFNNDISNNKYVLNIRIYISSKRKEWIDIQHDEKIQLDIPKPQKEENTPIKPFIYPLDKNIGVTQWHGCTKYQCPHGGIDFGAKLDNVISIGEGIVQKVGYDKYGGECNQGGNFVIVKHTNGMYSAYFHLNKYYVKEKQHISKGEIIGISGNSGKWNCQNLGYHLHFETRENISSSSHINPVPLIDIDWNNIKTIGEDIYPGRLTGDNPHPSY